MREKHDKVTTKRWSSNVYNLLTAVVSLRHDKAGQAHSHGAAWGGKCHPTTIGCLCLSPLGILLEILYCCLVCVDKQRSLKFQLNHSRCDILESSIFSFTHIVHFIVIT